MKIISTTTSPVTWTEDGETKRVWITEGVNSYAFPLDNEAVLLQLNAMLDVGAIQTEIPIPKLDLTKLGKAVKKDVQKDPKPVEKAEPKKSRSVRKRSVSKD